MYRRRLAALARKAGMEEADYARTLLEQAGDRHLGFLLYEPTLPEQILRRSYFPALYGVSLLLSVLIGLLLGASTPILFAALGELVVERAGVLNLGVEGMMITGALAGFGAAYSTGNPFLGFLVAAFVVLLSVPLHARLAVDAGEEVSGHHR